ncbi:uncharacterized mitochondrial protein-like protein [Tanacetum coccineum]|uniref:Uncharacterized mitochondrial protein-like protein n=1 Tax=Tanacetum coccineum TaxID=301880 RepID=A0ABQ4XCF9_9ASTR
MPELEDIVYSNDDEDVGAEADMNSLDAFIPVSPTPTTRIHKDHPVEQIIRDLNSAPQTRRMTKNLKEHGLFSSVQQRINHKDFQLLVCLLFMTRRTQEDNPSIKESKIEAIRLFLACASFKDFVVYQIDVKSAFLYEKIEEEVYVCQPLGFEDPDFPDRKEDGVFISQDKYMTEILKKFGFTDVETASTPMETHKPLLKDADGKDVDEHIYRSMIRSLMYLTSSRPDIIYLKGQPKLGLWYPKDSPFDLVAYTNSDYAGASLDRKSTTGDCQFLRCRLISWQCKKQTMVANSTTEAKYVVVSSCYGLKGIGVNAGESKLMLLGINLLLLVRKQKSRKSKKKNTEVPQPSGSTDNVLDENVPTTSNDPLLSGEDRLKLTELIDLCTNLQKKVLDLEKAKTAQDSEIASLKKKVKKLEMRNKSAQVVSSKDKGLGDQEDASKQGRKIADIDADAEVEKVVSTAEVTTESATTTTVDELTLAQTLIKIKAAKPKVRGVMIQEPSEFTTTTTTTTRATSNPSQDKGKAKIIEFEKPLKKKD